MNIKDEELREYLRTLIERVNKWNMYVPSAEAEAEIKRTVDLIHSYGLEQRIEGLREMQNYRDYCGKKYVTDWMLNNEIGRLTKAKETL